MLRTPAIMVCCLFLCGVAFAYPENYASPKLGASVITRAEIEAKRNPNTLLSESPVPRGEIAFARISQQQVLTVDLGDQRIFDRVDFGTGSADGSRAAGKLRIDIASESVEGPYKPIFEQAGRGYYQVIRLPKIKARWVRFDLGQGAEGFSIHSIRIYKAYEHPRLSEAARLLSEKIKPALPGFDTFYKAVEDRNWSLACAFLRAHCAETHLPVSGPEPTLDLDQADRLMTGDLGCEGVNRQEIPPIDWARLESPDWVSHRSALSRGDVIAVAADACFSANDQKRARYLKSLFYDWIDANPQPTVMSGDDYPTWTSSDTAARLKVLVSRFAALSADTNIDDEMWANWLYSIWEHADYLSNDTFSIGESAASAAAAVVTAATEFPFFSREQDWLTYGLQSLERVVPRDVASDGKIVDDSPAWVALAYSSLTEAANGLQKAGKKVGSDVRERIGRIPKFLSAMTRPDGRFEPIGDDIPRYAVAWDWDAAPAGVSAAFPLGGWCVMRAECEQNASEIGRQLVLKASRGPHSHRDSLAISIYAFGRELLIDGGRDTRTVSHNTTWVDTQDQPDLGGRLDRWFSNAGVDWAVASHHAYKDVTVIRSIAFVKPDYWLVRDELQSDVARTHTFSQNWWVGADAATVEDQATMMVQTTWAGGPNILMMPADRGSLASAAIGEGALSTTGWSYTRSGQLPILLDTLLCPYLSELPPAFSIERLGVEAPAKSVMALKVTTADGVDYVIASRKGPQAVLIPSEQIRTDAEVAIIRMRGGKAVRLSGQSIRNVSIGGTTLVNQDQPLLDVDLLL